MWHERSNGAKNGAEAGGAEAGGDSAGLAGSRKKAEVAGTTAAELMGAAALVCEPGRQAVNPGGELGGGRLEAIVQANLGAIASLELCN